MADALKNLLTPANLGRGEKMRGLGCSVVSGLVTSGLVYLGVTSGLGIEWSQALIGNLFGNFLSYSLDIFFAKSHFNNSQVPYTDFLSRYKWWSKSLLSKFMFRFIVSVILDTAISLVLLRSAIEELDRRQIMASNPKLRSVRNVAVALLISVFTFLLYVNILRFDWAYNETSQPLLNTMVLMWTTVSLVLFASFYTNLHHHQNNNPEKKV